MAPSDESRAPGRNPDSRNGDRLAPPPEYRPTRGQGADNSMRNLAFGAVALAAVVMGGVYLLSGHRSAAVPVIEPDTTPIRVKPANRGGMKVAGADDAMLNEQNGVEQDALAPPPEAPAPQALQRQNLQQPKPAAASPVHPPPAAVSPSLVSPKAASAKAAAPETAAPEAPLPLPPPPAAPPRPATHAPAPAAPPPAARTAGGPQVQLAALDSEAAATAAWTQLNHRMPELLAGRSPSIQRFERDGRTYFRLRTGGFHDIAEATEFCARIRAKGGGCAIASF